eukprot:Opistho-2@57946
MAERKIQSLLPVGLLLIGWFLLVVYTAKISYDANHPMNNNYDNTTYLYGVKNAGTFWFLWLILAFQLATVILSVMNKPIAASRLFVITIILLFQYFIITSRALTPCNSNHVVKTVGKTACQYNSLGMAGTIISFVGAVLGTVLIGTGVSEKFN